MPNIKSKSEIANKYGIRISAPHGYYPEDVDEILSRYEGKLALLTKEKSDLQLEIKALEKSKENIMQQFQALQFQVSTMEIPLPSKEQEFAALSKINNISSPKATTSNLKPHQVPTDEAQLQNDGVLKLNPDINNDSSDDLEIIT